MPIGVMPFNDSRSSGRPIPNAQFARPSAIVIAHADARKLIKAYLKARAYAITVRQRRWLDFWVCPPKVFHAVVAFRLSTKERVGFPEKTKQCLAPLCNSRMMVSFRILFGGSLVTLIVVLSVVSTVCGGVVRSPQPNVSGVGIGRCIRVWRTKNLS